jgi:nucleotide-binding universal stress UspA family protein
MKQTNSDSGRIICATRGGEGSEPTVERAIELARERQVGVTFLHIADLEFMRRATTGHVSLAAEELRKMGEFLMIRLVDRAQEEGVEADFAVRQGRFEDQLLRYLVETRPATLILGCPQPDTCLLEPPILARVAREVERQTGVQVEML